MKTLFSTLILILVICLSSCDGRDRVFKTNTEVLIENKLLDSFSEKITYIPETYTEFVTDTILSNGFHVKMKTFTTMNKHVLNEFKQDSIIHKEYHREFVSEVIITKHSKEIFNQRIDKQFFHNLKNNLSLKNAIVNVIVDEASSIEKNTIILSAMIKHIHNEKIKFCDIIIDSEGKIELKEIDELYAFSK
jgi:hypothetical protein